MKSTEEQKLFIVDLKSRLHVALGVVIAGRSSRGESFTSGHPTVHSEFTARPNFLFIRFGIEKEAAGMVMIIAKSIWKSRPFKVVHVEEIISFGTFKFGAANAIG